MPGKWVKFWKMEAKGLEHKCILHGKIEIATLKEQLQNQSRLQGKVQKDRDTLIEQSSCYKIL